MRHGQWLAPGAEAVSQCLCFTHNFGCKRDVGISWSVEPEILGMGFIVRVQVLDVLSVRVWLTISKGLEIMDIFVTICIQPVFSSLC